MLTEGPIVAALHRFLQRLPGGEVYSHSVGECNALQGHAIYLDYPVGLRKLRLLLLFLRKQEDYAYHHCLSWRPDWDYEVKTLLSGLELQPALPGDWDRELLGFEPKIRQMLRKGPPPPKTRSAERLPAFPEAEYPVLAAALLQRMQGWKLPRLYLCDALSPTPTPAPEKWPILQTWCPLLSNESLQQHARRQEFQLDLRLLRLPVEEAGPDVVDLYRAYPQAHGRLSLSAPGYRADGQQAVLVIDHEVGFCPYVADSWQGPTPTPPDGPRPGPFREVLILELVEGQWKLVERLDGWLPSAPWEQEKKAREKLQSELGDWAVVEKVVFSEGELSDVWLRRPEGLWRAVSAVQLSFSREARVFLEPTLWIPNGRITADRIREAHANPAS